MNEDAATVPRGPSDPDASLARVIERAAKGGTSRRSRLFLWFRKHYGPLSHQAAELGAAPWADWMAQIWEEPDLLDAKGNKPKLRTAQETYYAVCRLMRREREKREVTRESKPVSGPRTPALLPSLVPDSPTPDRPPSAPKPVKPVSRPAGMVFGTKPSGSTPPAPQNPPSGPKWPKIV